MSQLTTNQPEGTPTWVDLAVADPAAAAEFYRSLFGWETDRAPDGYLTCLLRGLPVAGIAPLGPSDGAPEWTVYFATDNCDGTARRITDAGGRVVSGPLDVPDEGRTAIAYDPVGARFGLWEGRGQLGCQLVNEPDTLVRNDLLTPSAERARAFYTAVFGYTLDGNDDMPDFDFTFLRRPDGHEIGGIMGVPDAPSSRWETLFEVADTDAVVARAVAAGGKAGEIEDMIYARIAAITDPFGAEFSVGTRPPGAHA